RYQFPSKYIENLTAPVSHDFLMKLHKIFRWSINMNSVKYSETMFANRVYELQAFGNILLSNYNTGINNLFPNVRMVHAPDDFKVIYGTDEESLKDLQAKGIRNVMSKHTTFERINQIASDIGMNIETPKEKVLVVFDEESTENKANFDRQIYKHKTGISKDVLDSKVIADHDFIVFFS